MLQLIAGCGDRKVQQDLMASRDLTLERVIDVMAAADRTRMSES